MQDTFCPRSNLLDIIRAERFVFISSSRPTSTNAKSKVSSALSNRHMNCYTKVALNFSLSQTNFPSKECNILPLATNCLFLGSICRQTTSLKFFIRRLSKTLDLNNLSLSFSVLIGRTTGVAR